MPMNDVMGNCKSCRKALRGSRRLAGDFPSRSIAQLRPQGSRAGELQSHFGFLRNLNLGNQRKVRKRPTCEPVQCDSSSSSANLNRAAPVPPLKDSFCDKTLPTSDSHTAAVRTSSYIASLRLHGRSGNSTSVSWPGKRELETDLPKPRRKLLREGWRCECPDGFCEQMS